MANRTPGSRPSRSIGPERLTAAITAPAASSTGALTEATPAWRSPTLRVFGGRAAPTVAEGLGFPRLADAVRLRLRRARRIGDEPQEREAGHTLAAATLAD